MKLFTLEAANPLHSYTVVTSFDSTPPPVPSPTLPLAPTPLKGTNATVSWPETTPTPKQKITDIINCKLFLDSFLIV